MGGQTVPERETERKREEREEERGEGSTDNKEPNWPTRLWGWLSLQAKGQVIGKGRPQPGWNFIGRGWSYLFTDSQKREMQPNLEFAGQECFGVSDPREDFSPLFKELSWLDFKKCI